MPQQWIGILTYPNSRVRGYRASTLPTELSTQRLNELGTVTVNKFKSSQSLQVIIRSTANGEFESQSPLVQCKVLTTTFIGNHYYIFESWSWICKLSVQIRENADTFHAVKGNNGNKSKKNGGGLPKKTEFISSSSNQNCLSKKNFLTIIHINKIR